MKILGKGHRSAAARGQAEVSGNTELTSLAWGPGGRRAPWGAGAGCQAIKMDPDHLYVKTLVARLVRLRYLHLTAAEESSQESSRHPTITNKIIFYTV